MSIKTENSISQKIADQSPRKTARIAGLFYLIFILATVLATYVRGRFIVSGDAVATANNIVSSQGLFRIGFVTELVSAVFFVLAAWALYVLELSFRFAKRAYVNFDLCLHGIFNSI